MTVTNISDLFMLLYSKMDINIYCRNPCCTSSRLVETAHSEESGCKWTTGGIRQPCAQNPLSVSFSFLLYPFWSLTTDWDICLAVWEEKRKDLIPDLQQFTVSELHLKGFFIVCSICWLARLTIIRVYGRTFLLGILWRGLCLQDRILF